MVKEPSYQERFPEWRSSAGVLKEKKGGGQDKVTGYRSSEREKRQGEEPQKVWDLANAYGSLSAGMNKKKELILVASQRHRKDLRALSEESIVLDGQDATKVLELKDFQTNEPSARRKESAIGFRFQRERTPSYLLSRMRKLAERRDLEVQKTMLPFLTVEEDKQELRYLQECARKLSENRLPVRDSEEEQGIRKRTQFLTAVVAEKEAQQRMLHGKLQDLLEAARKGERGGWDFVRFVSGEIAGDTDMGSGGNEAEDENENDTDANDNNENQDKINKGNQNDNAEESFFNS